MLETNGLNLKKKNDTNVPLVLYQVCSNEFEPLINMVAIEAGPVFLMYI